MHVPVVLVPEELSKEEKYKSALQSIVALTEGETSLMANLANIAAVLRSVFGWWWVGFYLVEEKQLVLGPFQGPVACTRISYGKGVCGTAWLERKMQIVPDVDQFPGHIACSAESRSEIVVPLMNNGEVFGVLDADSAHYNTFDETDGRYLSELAAHISATLQS